MPAESSSDKEFESLFLANSKKKQKTSDFEKKMKKLTKAKRKERKEKSLENGTNLGVSPAAPLIAENNGGFPAAPLTAENKSYGTKDEKQKYNQIDESFSDPIDSGIEKKVDLSVEDSDEGLRGMLLEADVREFQPEIPEFDTEEELMEYYASREKSPGGCARKPCLDQPRKKTGNRIISDADADADAWRNVQVRIHAFFL